MDPLSFLDVTLSDLRSSELSISESEDEEVEELLVDSSLDPEVLPGLESGCLWGISGDLDFVLFLILSVDLDRLLFQPSGEFEADLRLCLFFDDVDLYFECFPLEGD